MSIDKRKLNGAIKRTSTLSEKLQSACDDIEKLIQPYFTKEIFVSVNPADGIIIEVANDDLSLADWNLGIDDVIESISKEPACYLHF